MHRSKKHVAPLFFMFAHCVAGCNYYGQRYLNSSTLGIATTSDTTPIPTAMTCPSAVAADSLAMVCVPGNTTGFVMDDTNIYLTHTVASITAFAMAKYEVQYGDWQTIQTWGTGNGYSFANTGSGTAQEPVTNISWRDSIIWCNAASQKAGLTPVYYTDAAFTTPLVAVDGAAVSGATTTAGAEDNPYVNWSANGYRLPTEAEWEYAARYQDGITFTPGNYASGATADYSVYAADDAVAWFGNSITPPNGNTTTIQPVGTKAPNLLGIYDMSGNVYEWLWDWDGPYTVTSPYTDADSQGPTSGTNRANRGGSWQNSKVPLRCSARAASPPDSIGVTRGFRPVRRP